MKTFILALSITFNIFQALHASEPYRPEASHIFSRESDMVTIAEATLDAMGDDSGLSVYEFCNPDFLISHVREIEASGGYANNLFESCDRLNFRY